MLFHMHMQRYKFNVEKNKTNTINKQIYMLNKSDCFKLNTFIKL